MMTTPILVRFLLVLGWLLLPSRAFAADRPVRVLAPYFQVNGASPGVESLPLKESRASVKIAGVIAKVQVMQVYANEGDRAIEAVYVFPGSTRSAVVGMEMKVGDRTIQAKLKTRAAAAEAYENARNKGQTASLLEQERPNVFTMKVANIMPGDRIEVHLNYVEALQPTAGVYEFVYPTVVGPRYSEKTSLSDPEETWIENPHTPAGQAASYQWDLKAGIESGIAIRDLSSPSHTLQSAFASPTSVHIDVDDAAGGNRDFVLRYRLAGAAVETGLMLFPGDKENFFLAMVQPPKTVAPASLPAREYIFIIDVSGSMGGFPMQTAKVLMGKLFSTLTPRDKVNLMMFSGGSTVLAEESLPATRSNLAKARAAVDAARGGGGTQLLEALQRALAIKRSGDIATTFVVITDGYVSVEKETFELIKKSLGEANLFAFGIGSSVNRHLIEGLARAGMGEAFVALDEREATKQAGLFASYISSPVLTGVQVKFQGFDAYDLAPAHIPDVFSERPVMVIGKYRGQATGKLVLQGHDGQGLRSQELDIATESNLSAANEALRYLWARHRIAELEDKAQLGDSSVKKTVTQLSLKYGLMSSYTSFVAVDSSIRNSDGQLRSVRQTLPMPQGVSNASVGTIGLGNYGTIGHGGGVGVGGGGSGYGYGTGSGKRGLASSVPAVRMGSVITTGSLDKSIIRRLIRRHTAKLRYCYEKGLVKDPKLAGTVTLRLTIGAKGIVVESTANGIGNERVESCIREVAKQIVFPAIPGGGTVQVTYPLRFEPG